MSDRDLRDGWSRRRDGLVAGGKVLSSESCAREEIAEFIVLRGVSGVGGFSGKGLMSACVGGRTCREVEGVEVMAVALSKTYTENESACNRILTCIYMLCFR